MGPRSGTSQKFVHYATKALKRYFKDNYNIDIEKDEVEITLIPLEKEGKIRERAKGHLGQLLGVPVRTLSQLPKQEGIASTSPLLPQQPKQETQSKPTTTTTTATIPPSNGPTTPVAATATAASTAPATTKAASNLTFAATTVVDPDIPPPLPEKDYTLPLPMKVPSGSKVSPAAATVSVSVGSSSSSKSSGSVSTSNATTASEGESFTSSSVLNDGGKEGLTTRVVVAEPETIASEKPKASTAAAAAASSSQPAVGVIGGVAGKTNAEAPVVGSMPQATAAKAAESVAGAKKITSGGISSAATPTTGTTGGGGASNASTKPNQTTTPIPFSKPPLTKGASSSSFTNIPPPSPSSAANGPNPNNSNTIPTTPTSSTNPSGALPQSIPLKKEGYKKALQEADFIFIAAHSQGVPVSTILLDLLIQCNLIDPTTQRILFLAMAGIWHGPFPSIQSVVRYMDSPVVNEFFELCNTDSEISKVLQASLAKVLAMGNVKCVAVASWYDEVVPFLSGICQAFDHPSLFRAIYIDESIQDLAGIEDEAGEVDFLTQLVQFSLKLRNRGLSDHGLSIHLSKLLAGAFFGQAARGHSTLYEEIETYT
jgi:hypothetical protein